MLRTTPQRPPGHVMLCHYCPDRQYSLQPHRAQGIKLTFYLCEIFKRSLCLISPRDLATFLLLATIEDAFWGFQLSGKEETEGDGNTLLSSLSFRAKEIASFP